MIKDTTKNLRWVVIIFWIFALISVMMNNPVAYLVFSSFVAMLAAMLIYSSRNTQGHYRNISTSYMLASITWSAAEILRIASLRNPDNELLHTASLGASYLPLCFFALGLVLFSYSEYNDLHFRKMMLHTVAVAFIAFMIMQKLVFVHWAGINTRGIEMLGVTLYFFLIVFTVVLVMLIFVQTNFRGHTTGTNLSAVILIIFNLTELNRLYNIALDDPDLDIRFEVVGLLGLVIYSWAQSDPELIERKTEPEPIDPSEHVNNSSVLKHAAVFFVIGALLYFTGFFDTRDVYLMIIALMSYAVIYKSIQANVYSMQLLESQKRENMRLEQMVEEKTCELRFTLEQLREISETDELTGLSNRRSGMRKIQELLEGEESRAFAILLMDLNHFKQVNDTYGHETGDQLLKEIGLRLRSLKDEITPIRLGGDEFLLIAESDSPDDLRQKAEDIAERICKLIDEPVSTDAAELIPSACIGISLCPQNSRDRDTLYRLADEAMYGIKHKNKGSSFNFAD